MSISIAELVALVKMDGAATAQAQLLATSASFDRTALSAKSFEEMSRMSSASAASALKGIAPAVAPIGPAVTTAGVAMKGAGTEAMMMGTRLKVAAAMGSELWKLAGIATLVGGAIAVGVGVLAVKAAGNYEAALTRLFTTAGESQKNLGMVGRGMLDMSTQVGTGAQTLAQAMYFVESGGVHGKKALDDLRIAAMGAKTENSDLTGVVKVLMSTLNAYAGTGLTAAGAMNTLIAAVSQGHMTLNDLAGGLSNVLPATARFHISLIDTTAAIAEMTKQGDDAATASTHLRQMILSLEAPSKIGAASLKEVGLSSQALSNEMKKSLPGAIQMVTDAVGKKFPEGSAAYNEAIKNIAGGSRQMMGFLELSGAHTKDFANIVKIMSGDVKAGGSSIMGWAAVQQNFNFKIDQAKAAIGSMLIGIGQQLLPKLSQLMAVILPLIAQFANWVVQSHAVENVMTFLIAAVTGVITVVSTVVKFFQQNTAALTALKVVGIAVAGMIAAVMVAAFIAWAIAAGAAAIATLAATWPILAIGAVIALVVAGIILAIQHWGQIMAWIQGVLGAVGGFIGGVFSAMGTKAHEIVTSIGNFFSGMGTKIHDALNAAAVFMITKFNDILTFVKSIPGKIGAALATLAGILVAPFLWLYNHNYYVKAAVDAIILDLQNLRALIGNIFSAIGTTISNFLSWLKTNVGSAFNWVGTHVRDVLTATKNTVGSIFSAIGTTIRNLLTTAKNDVGNIFSQMGSLVSQKVNDLKNAVGNAFSALGSMMHQKLVDAWNGLVSFASGWPSAAFRWGANLVQGLINGLGSLLGAVRDKVGQIAGAIGNFLGFHSPAKEGPGATADTWMPNLINMFVRDLSAGQGKMKAALSGLMTPLAASMHVSATGSLSGMSGLSGSVARSVALSGGQPTIVVNVQSPDINMDGWKLTDRLMPHLASKIRWNVPGGVGR